MNVAMTVKLTVRLKLFVWNQGLYGLGARKIGVTSLAPLGCFPAALTLFGFHENGCVSRINSDAQNFNKKLNAVAANLLKQHSDLKIVIFDIFTPLYGLIKSPSKSGLCCHIDKLNLLFTFYQY